MRSVIVRAARNELAEIVRYESDRYARSNDVWTRPVLLNASRVNCSSQTAALIVDELLKRTSMMTRITLILFVEQTRSSRFNKTANLNLAKI